MDVTAPVQRCQQTDGAFVSMRQRQNGERCVLGGIDGFRLRRNHAGGNNIGNQIAVRQHNPFRGPRRSGSIDDRRRILFGRRLHFQPFDDSLKPGGVRAGIEFVKRNRRPRSAVRQGGSPVNSKNL